MKIAYINKGRAVDPFYIGLKNAHDVERFTTYEEIKDPNYFDVLFIEYLGINAISASKYEHKNLIVRTHGVEIYESEGLSNIRWKNIKHFLAFQQHQIDYFQMRYPKFEPQNFGVLPLTAPLEEFQISTRPVGKDNNKVALVANITGRKGFDQIPEILLKYPQLSVYHLGKPMKYGHPVEEFVRWRLERDGTSDRYVYNKWVDSGRLASWYKDKKYILLPSISEGFCRAVLEGMCMGLKPIIRNWAGAETIYPKECLYNTTDDIKKILDMPYEPQKYREYAEKNYGVEVIINKLNNFLI